MEKVKKIIISVILLGVATGLYLIGQADIQREINECIEEGYTQNWCVKHLG